MSLSKNGFLIDCAKCVYQGSSNNNDFTVTVPLSDIDEDKNGNATLKCAVTDNEHIIHLQSYLDASGNQMPISNSSKKRLMDALHFVGVKKVCGNRKICPPEVVEAVKKK